MVAHGAIVMGADPTGPSLVPGRARVCQDAAHPARVTDPRQARGRHGHQRTPSRDRGRRVGHVFFVGSRLLGVLLNLLLAAGLFLLLDAERLGIAVNVAHIEGDDLMARIDGLRPQLTNLDTGEPFTATPVSANAYLGGWGIAAALDSGADVVICPRVTDASVVVGPAAWWWGWAHDDWDALAGAVVAGHVIECGAQTTGGNYSFFEQIPDLLRAPGFPLAEIDRVIDDLHAESKATASKMKADAKSAVSSIRKGAAQAAAELIREVNKKGADEKTAVRKAGNILKEAEQTAEKLNRHAEKSLQALAKETDQAARNIHRALDTAASELATVKEEAIRQVVGAAKVTARNFPANVAPDDPETRQAREAAAEVPSTPAAVEALQSASWPARAVISSVRAKSASPWSRPSTTYPPLSLASMLNGRPLPSGQRSVLPHCD